MIKVLLLSSSYPSHHEDVHSTFMRELAESLAEMGISVYVLCPHQNGLLFHEIQNGIKIIRFPYWFTTAGQKLGSGGGIIPSIHHCFWTIFQIIPFCIFQFITASRVIKRENIDLIHSHWLLPQGIVGALIQMTLKIPHIASVHGTDIHIIHSHRSLHPLLQFISKNTNFITTNSNHSSRLVQDIISHTSTRVIPMGIDSKEFTEYSINNQSEKKTILFVGRLITWKGVHILIEATNILKEKKCNIQVMIVGDGPNRDELINFSKRMMVDSIVHFLGKISRHELLSYYKMADVFVLPSILHKNQTEGLGVVLLEAMASGIPVIGSNIGGIPDIIENKVNGLLVPPGDPVALANSIYYIINNPDRSEKFKDEGFFTVKNRFSWSVISTQFIELYQKICKKHNETPFNGYHKHNIV